MNLHSGDQSGTISQNHSQSLVPPVVCWLHVYIVASADSRVLITGPTGSGKELVARKIHKNSSRSKDPFIVLNAALLQEKRYEKELFGEEYEDGLISYGILEKANKGTAKASAAKKASNRSRASTG